MPLNAPTPREAGAGAAMLAVETVSPKSYEFLQQYIYAESGIVLDEGKQYLVESRLTPVLRTQNIASMEVLCSRLAGKTSPYLSRLVVEAMITSETTFFRDTTTFEALRKEVLPGLFQRVNGSRRLRIWSAAASTGQEAYSLAMMILEMGKASYQIEILGTDLSEQVLERARKGRYGQFEVNRGLPSSYLKRYFTQAGVDWQIGERVRGMVRFEQRDLRNSMKSMGSFDLILCRNVLIYFDSFTRGRILVAMKKDVLAPGGVLVLGCAETIVNVEGLCRTPVGQATVYASDETPGKNQGSSA